MKQKAFAKIADELCQRLELAFDAMDFSKAKYQPEINRVTFPYKEDLIWELSGDRWCVR